MNKKQVKGFTEFVNENLQINDIGDNIIYFETTKGMLRFQMPSFLHDDDIKVNVDFQQMMKSENVEEKFIEYEDNMKRHNDNIKAIFKDLGVKLEKAILKEGEEAKKEIEKIFKKRIKLWKFIILNLCILPNK